MVQGELFIDEGQDAGRQSVASFFSRNQLSLGFDKIVLLLIACVVLFVLTYSFGYERGKRAAERKIQSMTAHIETVTAVPTPPDVQVSSVGDSAQPVDVVSSSEAALIAPAETGKSTTSSENTADLNSMASPTLAEVEGKYTIQVSTALSKAKAEKEVSKLTSLGFKSFYIQRDRFFEICVGSFDTVANAKPVLSDFKTKGPYLDAYVRPNPHF